jgi:hypothetical protein
MKVRLKMGNYANTQQDDAGIDELNVSPDLSNPVKSNNIAQYQFNKNKIDKV